MDLLKKIKSNVIIISQLLLFNLSWLLLKNTKLKNLKYFEKKIYSQNGEDGIIEVVFRKVKPLNNYYVEIGSGDGSENNTKYLKEKGWKGIWFDKNYSKNKDVIQKLITKENINDLFKKYNIPKTFDVLSIDIDGNDYWIWKALKGYQPQLVVIEYNSSIPSDISKVIPYNPKFTNTKTNYFGASLKALNKLATMKGYDLLYCEKRGVNAFFLRKNLFSNNFKRNNYSNIFKSPGYGIKKNGIFRGHKEDPRTKTMLEV
jgi:hypothetical protein